MRTNEMTTLRLTPRLIAAFFAVGLLPFLSIGFLSLQKSGGALEERAFNQLAAVQAIKSNEIEKFFAERRGNMGVLVETVDTLRREAFNKLSAVQAIKKNQLEQYFQRAGDQSVAHCPQSNDGSDDCGIHQCLPRRRPQGWRTGMDFGRKTPGAGLHPPFEGRRLLRRVPDFGRGRRRVQRRQRA